MAKIGHSMTGENHPMYKHGMTETRIYRIWCHMKGRCLCKTNPKYPRYGERGIKICSEWLDFMTFYDWAINNGYAENLTIDRIDNDGNYSPQNCRWISMEENNKNKSLRPDHGIFRNASSFIVYINRKVGNKKYKSYYGGSFRQLNDAVVARNNLIKLLSNER